jgi:hypothetical protein
MKLEALAFLCVPNRLVNGFFSLTPYGLDFIAHYRETGFHEHRTELPLYRAAEHNELDDDAVIQFVDLRS